MISSKVYKGFLETRSFLWVEASLAYMALSFAVIMVMLFRIFEYLYVLAFQWFFMHLMMRHDPSLFEAYKRYRKQADRYEPWPMANQRRRLRPLGFGRSRLC